MLCITQTAFDFSSLSLSFSLSRARSLHFLFYCCRFYVLSSYSLVFSRIMSVHSFVTWNQVQWKEKDNAYSSERALKCHVYVCATVLDGILWFFPSNIKEMCVGFQRCQYQRRHRVCSTALSFCCLDYTLFPHINLLFLRFGCCCCCCCEIHEYMWWYLYVGPQYWINWPYFCNVYFCLCLPQTAMAFVARLWTEFNSLSSVSLHFVDCYIFAFA